jgi:hypothetical protein
MQVLDDQWITRPDALALLRFLRIGCIEFRARSECVRFSQREKRYQVAALVLRQPARVQRALLASNVSD